MDARGGITLGVLAGGRASRLGGVDKALALHRGSSLLARTLDALGHGFSKVLVSYNGEPSALAGFDVMVVPDARAGRQGPLAGLESLLEATRSEWLLSVPVDLCLIPPGLAEILSAHVIDHPGCAAGVLVSDADGLQPLVGLWRVDRALDAVAQALDAGQRAVHPLLESMPLGICQLSMHRLGNLNSPSDFE